VQYNKPFDKSDVTASYVNGNPPAGVQGSIPPAEAIEYPQREIVAVIVAAGLTPTNTDLTQLLQAIRILSGVSGTALLHWGLDTGSVNAMVIAASPVLTAYAAGDTIITVPAQTNTSTTVTLNANGLGTRNVVKANGAALAVGDIQQSTLTILVYDGTNWRLNYPAKSDITALFPIVITAGTNTTLYVRTDGNDANDGSANTAGKAFATVAAAISYGMSRFSLAGGQLTIQLGIVGTYAAPLLIPNTLGTLIIQGDVAAQASYALSGAGPGTGSNGSVIPLSGGVCYLRGLTVINTGTNNNTLAAAAGFFHLDHVSFACTASNSFGHAAAYGGQIEVGPGCIFSNSMGSVLVASGSAIAITGNPTISGSPTFAGAVVSCANCGVVTLFAGVTVSGSCTGKRFDVSLNGVINTLGAGINAFPGTIAGTQSTGGQYA
jgi:hypothetical protein